MFVCLVAKFFLLLFISIGFGSLNQRNETKWIQRNLFIPQLWNTWTIFLVEYLANSVDRIVIKFFLFFAEKKDYKKFKFFKKKNLNFNPEFKRFKWGTNDDGKKTEEEEEGDLWLVTGVQAVIFISRDSNKKKDADYWWHAFTVIFYYYVYMFLD